jgi:hypothetical protein
VLVGLGALAALSVVATVAVLVARRESSPATTPQAPVPSASQPERVPLSITFGPPGVTAKLDGVPLAESPFKAQVPRDGSMHRLEVEGLGLEPQVTMISYDKEVALAIVLVPKPATTAPSAIPSAPPTAASPTAASPTAASPTAAGTPTAWGATIPGAGRPAGPLVVPKNTRSIDEQDPYKK